MAVIEKFLGKRVEIPEDRKYIAKLGLWAKVEDETMVFGFTEPALVLTPVNTKNSYDDGLLTASELADFPLTSRVAVLSACNTADIDTDYFATEVQGLTGALAMAGASSSIVTLTPVDSLSTRIIIEETFRGLVVRNRSAVEALAEGPEKNVAKLIEWCHHGPSAARVDRVHEKQEEWQGEFDTFDIVF